MKMPENWLQWRAACIEVYELIRAEKEKKWKEFVEELDCNTGVKDVWRTIRNIDGRNPPRNENEVLVVDGKGYMEDVDKANQFRKTYKGFSKISTLREDRKVQKKVYDFLNSSKPTPRREEEADITEK